MSKSSKSTPANKAAAKPAQAPTPAPAPKPVAQPAETPAQEQEAVSQQVHENLQRRGASMSEVTQSQASAQGTPSADAMAAVKGEIIANTPDGQKVIQPAVKETDTPPAKAKGSDDE